MEQDESDFIVESVAKSGRLDKLRYDILVRRQTTINSYKEYTRYKAKGHGEHGLIDFKIELGSLYLEVQQMILNELPNEKNKIYETIEQLERDLESENISDLRRAFNYIDRLLYSKLITKVDTRESIDTRDIFEMNRKGFY